MDKLTKDTLADIGLTHGTPAYVYFIDPILDRFRLLDEAFQGRFSVSYAVKCNPNHELLRQIKNNVITLDVSSIGEADVAIAAGFEAKDITFSGPAKRPEELRRAVELGVGEMVCESQYELETLDRLASDAGKRISVFIRVNPLKSPSGFGVRMAGKPSQFGIDEEDVSAVMSRFGMWTSLKLAGFHIYSGTNCLCEEAIAENFSNYIELFTRFSEEQNLHPKKLIFGSGFGIPYHTEENPLNIRKLADLITPLVDDLRSNPRMERTSFVLEMGRWLVGPHGYLITSVIGKKLSRGTNVCLCDAGFNNHLAACGMLGSVIRRNWQFWNVSAHENSETETYTLVGPLCTTIDVLASQIELPKLNPGSVLAIGNSGAYGLTASPIHFIGHPAPREFLVSRRNDRQSVFDVSS